MSAGKQEKRPQNSSGDDIVVIDPSEPLESPQARTRRLLSEALIEAIAREGQSLK